MFEKQLSKFSDTEKKMLYIAIVFITLAAFDRLFLGPATNQLDTVKQEISQQKSSIAKDLQFYSYKDQIIKENESFSKYMVPDFPEDDVVKRNFLSTVESIATESKVNIIKSNPAEIIRKEEHAEFFVNLDCAGPLPDVISFIHSINSTDEMLKVVRFNMSPKRGTENEVNASMTVERLLMSANLSTPPAATE